MADRDCNISNITLLEEQMGAIASIENLLDGKLTAKVELVENIAKDAHLNDQLIEKAEALEDQVEDFFESALNKARDVINDGEQPNVQVATEKKSNDTYMRFSNQDEMDPQINHL